MAETKAGKKEVSGTVAITVKENEALLGEGKNAIVITMKDIKDRFCPNANDKEMYLALNVIKSMDLNPFKREVHLVKYSTEPLQIITGYEVYLKRAERTHKLNGWNADTGVKKVMDTEGKETYRAIAFIDIWRKDWEKPFHWEIFLDEFDKKQATWKSMPSFMGKKVVMAQGFRLAFPDELGGMPYTAEEYQVYDIGKLEEKAPGNKGGTTEPGEKVEEAVVVEEGAPGAGADVVPEDSIPAGSAEEKASFSKLEDMKGNVGKTIDVIRAFLIEVKQREKKAKKDKDIVDYFVCDHPGGDKYNLATWGIAIKDIKVGDTLEFKKVVVVKQGDNVRGSVMNGVTKFASGL